MKPRPSSFLFLILKFTLLLLYGGWDCLAVSPVQDWLYVSNGIYVNILDKHMGVSVGVVLNVNGNME